MRKLVILLAATLAASPNAVAQNGPPPISAPVSQASCAVDHDKCGVLTVFREHRSPRISFNYADGDNWAGSWHFPLFINGQALVTQYADFFVSFELPAGHYTVSLAEKYKGEGSALDIEIVGGQRAFVRTAMGFTGGHWSNRPFLRPITCRDALMLGRDTQPMKAKNIQARDPLPEMRFPDSCEVADHR